MFGFGKKKTPAANVQACGEAAPQEKAGSGNHECTVLQVKVLGAGCAKCRELNENAKIAIADLGVDAELEYVTDMGRVMEYGAINLPALVVNGRIVSSGMVLSSAEVAEYIK